jgi:hypothetical protein
MPTADDQGPVPQFRPVALLNGGIERVAIDMANVQMLKFGVDDHARRPADGAAVAPWLPFRVGFWPCSIPFHNVGIREKCFAFATKAGHSHAPKDAPQFLTTVGFTLEFSSNIY